MSTKRPAPSNSDTVDSIVHKRARYPRDSAADFESPPISVVVGEDRKTFHVHEKHLVSSSDFFKNALNGQWKEQSSRTIELLECDADAFKIYVEWLYTARLCTTGRDDCSVSEAERYSIYTELKVLEACYSLGNLLQDIDFKDHLIDATTLKVEERIPLHFLTYIYCESPTKSPHRELGVDIAIYTWHKEFFDLIFKAKCELPYEFLADVVNGMSAILDDSRKSAVPVKEFLKSRDACRYHEHTMNNTPCYRVKRGFQESSSSS